MSKRKAEVDTLIARKRARVDLCRTRLMALEIAKLHLESEMRRLKEEHDAADLAAADAFPDMNNFKPKDMESWCAKIELADAIWKEYTLTSELEWSIERAEFVFKVDKINETEW